VKRRALLRSALTSAVAGAGAAAAVPALATGPVVAFPQVGADWTLADGPAEPLSILLTRVVWHLACPGGAVPEKLLREASSGIEWLRRWGASMAVRDRTDMTVEPQFFGRTEPLPMGRATPEHVEALLDGIACDLERNHSTTRVACFEFDDGAPLLAGAITDDALRGAVERCGWAVVASPQTVGPAPRIVAGPDATRLRELYAEVEAIALKPAIDSYVESFLAGEERLA
jgi:hypothetical protein